MGGSMQDLLAELSALPTPVIADAIVRLGHPVRQAPPGITGPPGARLAGPALPVRHSGSVDAFLEVLDGAATGDVMVIDNAGRQDEACIGDLVALEAQQAGVAGIVIWGLHRDAEEIVRIGLPVFSYGTLPFGPVRPRPAEEDRLTCARFGAVTVTCADIVVADANGVIFVPADRLSEVSVFAARIRDTEGEQVRLLEAGTSLRQQLAFGTYLRDRERDPARTFRQHLRDRAAAIEQ